MKTNIAKAQAAKQQKSLEKRFLFEGESITRKQFVEIAAERGYKFEVAQEQAVKNPSRRVWNSMSMREQMEFEKRQKEAGNKKEYRVYFPDCTFYTITKAEYDYNQQLMAN